MPRKSKKEKQTPNMVVFLVEGESDKIALEVPLANLIFDKFPDYKVLTLLQEKRVNKTGDEVEDIVGDGEDDEEDEYDNGVEYKYGGDITSSFFVTPSNIETKITNRFIIPSVKKKQLYPKLIVKVIQIVDLDGVYIPDDNVFPYSEEHRGCEKPFYDGDNGRIETKDVAALIDRNKRKRENLEHLLSLPKQKIKIKSKSIPYEVYFFSSNLDHFINNDANVTSGKKYLADRFFTSYGLDSDTFTNYFLGDKDSIEHMGYEESWNYIMKENNSVKRHTNIDCLIRKLLSDDPTL